MASYLSKPREFSQYQPTIDSEMYGKLLMKKEFDYQQGFQKINALAQSVADIPVSNIAEKNYLDEKISNITTEINKNGTVDWSNQSVQKTTSKYITDLSTDRVVQNAVYNSSQVKSAAQKRIEDVDTYGESAVLHNSAVFDEDYNKWYTQGKVGDRVNFGYTPFVDVQEGITNFLKELHPRKDVKQVLNVDKNGNQIKGAYEYTTYAVEGISPEVVQAQVNNYIATTPGVKDQLKVSGRYTYKNYDENTYLKQLAYSNVREIQHNEFKIHDLELFKAANPKDADAIQAQINAIKASNTDIKNFNYDDARELFRAGDKESLKGSLYERDFVQGVVQKYSYGNKYEMSYGGKSPFEQAKMINEMNNANIHSLIEQTKEKREQAKYEDELREKEGLNVPISVSMELKGQKDGFYNSVVNEAVTAQSDYNSSYANVLGNILQNGAYSKYFVKDKDHNTFLFNSDLAEELIGGVPAKKFLIDGYYDSSKKFRAPVLQQWMELSDKGKNELVIGDGVKIQPNAAQRLQLDRLRDKMLDKNAKEYKLASIDKEIENEPEMAEFKNKIDAYNRDPLIITTTTGAKIPVTGNTIVNYFKANKEGFKEYHKQKDSSDTKKWELLNKAYSKYGISPGIAFTMANSPQIEQIGTIGKDFKFKLGPNYVSTDDIQDRVAKRLGYGSSMTGIQISNNLPQEKKGSNSDLLQRLNTIAIGKGQSMSDLFSNAGFNKEDIKKILENPESLNIVYAYDPSVKDGNNYVVKMKVPGKSEIAEGYFNEAEITQTLGKKSLKPSSDPVYRTMMDYGGSTVPPGQPMVFENARDLGTVKVKGRDQKLRYHAEKIGADGYQFFLYATDPNDPHSKAVQVANGIDHNTDWDIAKQSLTKLIQTYNGR